MIGFRTDEQLENRFMPLRLELWSPGSECQKLLRGMEHLIPLREESKLAEAELAEAIRSRAGGLIGEIATLVSMAAVYAIREKQERIEVKTLDLCGYVPIHTRKRQK
uniref:Uncharacterized protein n=1 Tax=Curvibacter symbiont subsp. Hydra magnipapillata TaxID=667019 RepID=C9YBL1_CURXX|nr:hypothetical protein Csp_A15120 [Curvibacter putative symbiont of Hydra magnipapillata]